MCSIYIQYSTHVVLTMQVALKKTSFKNCKLFMFIAIDTVDNFKNLLLEQVFIKKHMNCNHEFEQVRSTYKMCVCIRRGRTKMP